MNQDQIIGISVTELIKGDGRKSAPIIQYPGARPLNLLLRPPRVSMVKMTITEFLRRGSTQHSGMRNHLPYVIAYCEENKISYSVDALFTDKGQAAGYVVTRKENFSVDELLKGKCSNDNDSRTQRPVER